MQVRGSNSTLVRAAVLLFSFWILALILLTRPLLYTNSSENSDILSRLSKAMSELDSMKQQNTEMQWILTNLSQASLNGKDLVKVKEELMQKLQTSLQGIHGSPSKLSQNVLDSSKNPSKEYEVTRRLIDRGVREMWFYVRAELVKLHKSLSKQNQLEIAKDVEEVLIGGSEHEKTLLTDLEKLSNLDGHDSWRAAEARSLSDLVQKRLHYLQNPKDCSKARKLICNLNKSCGYGCQIHHAAYCFIMAYATKRTMILQSRNWRYHRGGWEEIFYPVSDTCRDPSGEDRSAWPGKNDTQVVELPIVDMLSPRPPHLPLAIPRDISERLIRLHGDPPVWWVGQFLKYLLRYRPQIQKLLDEAKTNIGFQKPIVGVHVRRTDKVGTEAAFHSVDEYMLYVADYYQQLEMKEKVDVRRVYLASDDPSVLPEARKKYPKYEFIGDVSIAKGAAVATRYTDEALRGILTDIHLLANTDYLVCTFSSQVCRLAYEIMQSLHPDASARFKSLDDIYYYGGQLGHKQVAIHPHKSRKGGEISLEVGDVLGIAGNHWDGFSRGQNERTKQEGVYPSFKAVDQLRIVDFPSYSEADTG